MQMFTRYWKYSIAVIWSNNVKLEINAHVTLKLSTIISFVCKWFMSQYLWEYNWSINIFLCCSCDTISWKAELVAHCCWHLLLYINHPFQILWRRMIHGHHVVYPRIMLVMKMWLLLKFSIWLVFLCLVSKYFAWIQLPLPFYFTFLDILSLFSTYFITIMKATIFSFWNLIDIDLLSASSLCIIWWLSKKLFGLGDFKHAISSFSKELMGSLFLFI